jgi:glc operon protein GlcG
VFRTLAFLLSIAIAGAAQAAPRVENKPTLTLSGARAVVAAAEAEAHRNNAGGAIAVVDDGGNLLALVRLDGTFAAASNIAIAKARSAANFRKPTSLFENAIKNGRLSLVANDELLPLQGGVPVVIDGHVVGAVGVAGAASAQQDEDIANVAAAAGASIAAADATFIPSKEVSAAFAEGKPLVEVPGYKIHASRREKPGAAEVHLGETDTIHVLDGEATFVVGGTVVDGKTTAPEEIRGSAIDGGKTFNLKKGDVAVVPAGTPHWFREVKAPFLYYVVKVEETR